MRHPLTRLSAALLLCVLPPAGIAAAQSQSQSRPGWVDPPAKPPASAQNPIQKPAEPATQAAEARPDPAETLPARRTAERSSSPHASRRRAMRRPANALTAREPMPAAMAPVSEGRLSEWAGASQALARDYLDNVSAPGAAMVAAAPRFYGERVRFHGRMMTLAALSAEKRRFVQRWPERRYEPRSDTLRTSCSPAQALCRVEVVFDFRAENPAKGLRSQGVSSVTFEVSFAGPRPVIVSETSRVLRRDGPVSALGASRRPV